MGHPPFDLFAPAAWQVPLVVSAPHAGVAVPPGFNLPAGERGAAACNMSDTHIHHLALPAAAQRGFPVLASRFLRAFIDLNRSADELDPLLIDGAERSPRLDADQHARLDHGLGLIPRLARPQMPIYDRKLALGSVHSRIRRYHAPYHGALAKLIADCLAKFGRCTLLDLHSMPPLPPAQARRALAQTRGQPVRALQRFPASPANLVVGDCFGATFPAAQAAALLSHVQQAGLTVAHNQPYAGGWITAHYGRQPGVRSLQLEVCRSLYQGTDSTPHTKAMERVFLGLIDQLATPPQQADLQVAAQ